MDWNPLAPNFLGPEMRSRAVPGAAPSQFIGSGSVGIAQRFQSTATQTIASLRGYLQGAAPQGLTGLMLMEILAAGNEIPQNKATAVFRPNASTQTGTVWTNQVGSTTGSNLYLSVDEAVLNTSDYILTQEAPLGQAGLLTFEFATAGALAGKRILDVRLHIVGSDDSPTGPGASELWLGFDISGSLFGTHEIRGLIPPVTGERSISFGEFGTSGNGPFTVAQIQAMDTSAMRFYIIPNNPFPNPADNSVFRFFQVWIEVDYCDENRLARLVLVDGIPNSEPVWAENSSAAFINPSGSATWAKASGTDFTMLLRQMRYGDRNTPTMVRDQTRFRAYVPYQPTIDGEMPGPIADGALEVFPNVALNPADGTVLSLGEPATDRVFGMASIVVTTGATSVDSMSYSALRTQRIEVGDTGWQQELSGASAQAYSGVFLPLAVDESAGQVSTLTVNLRRRSDSALLATGTITRAQFLASPLEPIGKYWRVVQAPFAGGAVLAAATQYYIEFVQGAGNGVWQLQILDPVTTSTPLNPTRVPSGVPSYGGTSDVATLDASDVSTGDISVLLYASVAIPADVDADPVAITLPVPEACAPPADCGPAEIGGVEITWTAVSPGVFAYYEIQRSDDQTDWATVATIDTIGTDSWTDWGGRLNRESCYRIRQVSEAGPVSGWSATVCATAVMTGTGYTFTSNVLDQSAFVAYLDRFTSLPAVRGFEFPEAQEVIERRIYGRDYVTTYRPTERRGSRFVRSLNVNQYTTPSVPGLAAFDALRDLAHNSDAEYICVRDENGDRWFATITVPDAQISQPGEFYYATVTVIETTSTPE